LCNKWRTGKPPALAQTALLRTEVNNILLCFHGLWGIISKGDKMSLLFRTVQKEKERIDYMLSAYERQLDGLPKGSVTTKAVGDNVYYYLKYRNGKKVLTDYLGKDNDKVDAVRSALEKRRHIEAMITHLRAERTLANKVLKGQ
jgi:hypothetical protein